MSALFFKSQRQKAAELEKKIEQQRDRLEKATRKDKIKLDYQEKKDELRRLKAQTRKKKFSSYARAYERSKPTIKKVRKELRGVGERFAAAAEDYGRPKKSRSIGSKRKKKGSKRRSSEIEIFNPFEF